LVQTVKELDELFCSKLDWTIENVKHFLGVEEHGNILILKEKEWIPPAWKRKELIGLLENELGAQRLEDVKGRMRWQIELGGRKAEASISKTEEHTEPDIHQSTPPPAILPLDQLQNNVFCPRSEKARIDDLLESIPHDGLREKLVVRIHPDHATMAKTMYQIVSGHRRFRALKELGWKEAPVIVKSLTDQQARVEALKSNMEHGLSLSALEEAKWIQSELIENEQLTHEQVGERLGRSRSWVTQRLSLLKLGEEVNNVTRVTMLREVAKAPEETRPEVAEKALKEELSTRETAQVVEAVKEVPEQAKQILAKPGVPQLFSCGIPDCLMSTYDSALYHGVHLCASHRNGYAEDPASIEKLLSVKPSPPPTKVEPKIHEPPKLTWAERKDMMHPPVSKMEEQVAIALTEKGIPFEQHIDFCLESTNVDFHFPQANLVVELDGEEAHRKQEEWDKIKRDKLSRRHQKRVLVLNYKSVTDKNRDEILSKIMEALGE